MTLRTFNCSITAEMTSGPLPHGRVTFTLTHADIYQGVVVPTFVEVRLDANGQGVAQLWPNGDGTQGTQYRAIIRAANGSVGFNGLFTMPASNCNLHDVLDLVAPPTVDDATAAKLVAQAAAAAAGVSQSAAAGSASAAAASASQVSQTAAGLTASAGAALVGFIQSGTGAAASTVQSKLRERVSAEDFFIAGESSNGPMIQRAIDALSAAGGGILDLQAGTYTVNGLTLKDNVTLMGRGKEATKILLAAGANAHVIQAGDFDTNADGIAKAAPVGCRTGGLVMLTVDGNKDSQTLAKHGVAYYGVDMQMSSVEVRNCKGWSIYAEAPGATFSTTVGQNIQYNWRGVEAHDSDLGNIYYNGQSDSTLVDTVAYSTGTGSGQANLHTGTKATGCRWIGLHCWGGADYAIINEGSTSEFVATHAESAAIAKFWAKASFEWHGGRMYEASTNTGAVGFRLNAAYCTIIGLRASNINGGLIDTTGGGGDHSRIEIDAFTSSAGVPLYVGTISSSSHVMLRMMGSTTAALVQFSDKAVMPGLTSSGLITASAGIDLNSSGLDRVQYIAGQGWSSRSVSAGAISVGSSFIALNEASPTAVTDLTVSSGAQGIQVVTFRNSGTSAVTFQNNISKLRNNAGTDVVLRQYQSVTYTLVSGAIWQQIGGVSAINTPDNATIGGTLAAGASTLSSASVTGNATVGGTLGVAGAATLASAGVTGNASIGGTLGVGGAATLASAGITGNATVGGTLGVTGAATLSSASVTGNATVGGTLGVTGAATIASAAVTGAATVGGTLGVTGKITASNGVDFASAGADRTQFLAWQGWSSKTVAAGAISVASSLVVLSEAAPVTVTDLTQSTGAAGVPQVSIRNSGTNAVTMQNNTAKLRNISGADVVLNQHQSITYVFVSGSVWQQVGGKI